MLVISRRVGKAVVLIDDRDGSRTWVRLGRSREGVLRLEIDAPDHVRILREELCLTDASDAHDAVNVRFRKEPL